jgi:hypothetical protein
MTCRSCSSENLDLILDLGEHPWCNNFLSKEEIGKEKYYPLRLMYCNECELLQLDYTVPKETMFKNHTYVSSTTSTLKKHFLELALENKGQFNLTDSDLIVDIGGNDGTQLLQYKSIGLTNVINVESADNISQLSKESGVNTVNEFFNEETVDKYIGEKKVKLINASGVFFHLEELHSVIRGIKKCLQDDGVFIVQFMYAGTMVEKLNFDGIYHEHLCYYTLKSLSNLLNPYGLRIFDSYYSEIHSGSMIAKVCKQNSNYTNTDRHTISLKNDEKYIKQSFIDFSKTVESKKFDLRNLLSDLKKQNPSVKIYAYGAPAKGNTLLNYFNINNELIDNVVEVNSLKIGLYTPMSHIEIIKESLYNIPDYYLLLSHNFTEEILEKNKQNIENGVKFIIPFPEVKIIK